MNKTLLALLIAASLVACSSDNATSDDPLNADPTAAGNDPVTGMPADAGQDATSGTPADAANTTTEPADGGAVENDATSDPSPAPDTTPDTTGDTTTDDAPSPAQGVGPAQLSPANYEAVVSQVFAVYSGRAYGGDLLALPGYPAFDDLLITPSVEQGTVSEQQTCSNGGTADLSVDWSGARVMTFDRRGAFDNCQHGALLIDGEIEKFTADNYRIASSGLTVRNEADSTSVDFSGGAGYGDGNNFGGSQQTWWSTSELHYTRSSPGSVELSVIDATTSFETNPPVTHDLQGSFTLQYLGTEGGKIKISTPVPFKSERVVDFDEAYDVDDWNFQSGVLMLTAEDGSSVTVDADNGDLGSARVTLDYAGQSETFDKPWSDWDENFKGFTDLLR